MDSVAYETNILTVIGNLTNDVTLQYTAGGIAVARFRIAVNEKRGNRETKCFWSVDAWRSLAEHVAESLGTGDRAIVIGRTVDDEYTQSDGTKVFTKKIEADAVGPDLRFAVARPAKTATAAAFVPPVQPEGPEDGDPF